MKSKTLILSSQKKFATNSPRAILTFINHNNKTEGKLRLYNMQELPSASKLGIYYDEQVFTANLVKKDDAWNFYVDHNFNLDKNIYCAVVDRANENEVVLCGGTSNGFVFYEDEDDEQNLEEVETKQEIDKQPNKHEDYTPTVNEVKNKKLEKCTNCDTCEKCAYKEYFYSQQNSSLQDNKKEDIKVESILDSDENEKELESVSNSIENQQETTTQNIQDFDSGVDDNLVDTQSAESEKFLHAITDQLNDMFKTYPEDNEIMKIIPNSKIIKVTDSIDESCYIVGIIYEDNEIKYLLYGVPAKYSDTPPQELGKNYQWLPLDPEDPMSDGYFVIYQDATSGKIVPIKVE